MDSSTSRTTTMASLAGNDASTSNSAGTGICAGCGSGFLMNLLGFDRGICPYIFWLIRVQRFSFKTLGWGLRAYYVNPPTRYYTSWNSSLVFTGVWAFMHSIIVRSWTKLTTISTQIDILGTYAFLSITFAVSRSRCSICTTMSCSLPRLDIRALQFFQLLAVVWRRATTQGGKSYRWVIVRGTFVRFGIFGFTKESFNNYRATFQSVV